MAVRQCRVGWSSDGSGGGGGGDVKTTDGVCGGVVWKQRVVARAGTSGGGPGRAAYCVGCPWCCRSLLPTGTRTRTKRTKGDEGGSARHRAMSALSGDLGVWGAGRGRRGDCQTLACEPLYCRPIELCAAGYEGNGRRPLENSRILSWWVG